MNHDENCEYKPSGIDAGMDSCRCNERRLAKRVNFQRETIAKLWLRAKVLADELEHAIGEREEV